MTANLMTEQTSKPTAQPTPPPPTSRRLEPTVREIVEKARSAPIGSRGAWITAMTTSVLLWASFTPLDWGWLGWIALVPLCLQVRIQRPTRAMYRVSYAAGLAWSLLSLQWMRLGDVSMYPAWIALSFYLAMYFPAFLATARAAVHRFRLPLVLAVPLCWTGLEFARARLMTGFAWYFLGHTQHAWTEMIQISDLVGAYGVSFIVAMSSACIAALIPTAWIERLKLVAPVKVPEEFSHLPAEGMLPDGDETLIRRRQWIALAATLSVILAAFVYGVVRRSQADFQPGPRVALIQGNFPTSLKHDPQEMPRIFQYHDALTGMSVRHQPDVIVWPETMFTWPLQEQIGTLSETDLLSIAPKDPNFNRFKWVESWSDPGVRDNLREMSQRAGAAMFIGIQTWVAQRGGLKAYNSAAFVTPSKGYVDRYDKMHRVIFGEYVPLKDEAPWLRALTPFPEDYGISKGDGPKVFQHGGWNFAPIICFEDTVPELVRDIAHRSERVDVFVNLTNDGWFAGSSEADQHLITASFRAVECRTPIVRAVNTGISAVIDGDGVVVEPHAFIDGDAKKSEVVRNSMRDPKTGRWYRSLNAAIVADVPLDRRVSLYVRHGDWFAGSCGGATLLFACLGVFLRRKPA